MTCRFDLLWSSLWKIELMQVWANLTSIYVRCSHWIKEDTLASFLWYIKKSKYFFSLRNENTKRSYVSSIELWSILGLAMNRIFPIFHFSAFFFFVWKQSGIRVYVDNMDATQWKVVRLLIWIFTLQVDSLEFESLCAQWIIFPFLYGNLSKILLRF
jgi:hypothetical protein